MLIDRKQVLVLEPSYILEPAFADPPKSFLALSGYNNGGCPSNLDSGNRGGDL